MGDLVTLLVRGPQFVTLAHTLLSRRCHGMEVRIIQKSKQR